MSNFFKNIFKPSRKSNRENFQPLEDTIKQHHSRNEFDSTGRILKSSMRRRNTEQNYNNDDFLRAPAAAYHTTSQPQRHRGPKSLPPPTRAYEDSPNASASSSTDGGYGLERSFHSEFIPSSTQQPSSSSSRRRSKKHRIPSIDYYPTREEQRQRYMKEESDSESAQLIVEEEMSHAVKRIKKLQNSLKDSIESYRRMKKENDSLLKRLHLNDLEYSHKIHQLESEIAQLSQEKRSLELENQRLKSMGYQYGGMHHHHRYNYPPTYFQPQPPPPSQPPYTYMTPPSAGIRSSHLNNTNTGSMMTSGGDRSNYRGGPPRHHAVVENLFGNNDGSGEQLASANTTASQAGILPGMPMPPFPINDEVADEIKVFRQVDESSPSRPPTNSNQSLILSTGIGGSNSTNSSPPNNNNSNKTNEQTPIASIKKESPQASDPKMDAFNEIVLRQLNALTPKSSKVKKVRSLSTMDEMVVNFEAATNLNH